MEVESSVLIDLAQAQFPDLTPGERMLLAAVGQGRNALLGADKD